MKTSPVELVPASARDSCAQTEVVQNAAESAADVMKERDSQPLVEWSLAFARMDLSVTACEASSWMQNGAKFLQHVASTIGNFV